MFEILTQTATPDTANYMIGGYAVFFVVMILYLGSMLMRHRSLKQDMQVLEEIDNSQGEA